MGPSGTASMVGLPMNNPGELLRGEAGWDPAKTDVRITQGGACVKELLPSVMSWRLVPEFLAKDDEFLSAMLVEGVTGGSTKGGEAHNWMVADPEVTPNRTVHQIVYEVALGLGQPLPIQSSRVRADRIQQKQGDEITGRHGTARNHDYLPGALHSKGTLRHGPEAHGGESSEGRFHRKSLGVSKAIQGELQQVQSHDDASV